MKIVPLTWVSESSIRRLTHLCLSSDWVDLVKSGQMKQPKRPIEKFLQGLKFIHTENIYDYTESEEDKL